MDIDRILVLSGIKSKSEPHKKLTETSFLSELEKHRFRARMGGSGVTGHTEGVIAEINKVIDTLSDEEMVFDLNEECINKAIAYLEMAVKAFHASEAITEDRDGRLPIYHNFMNKMQDYEPIDGDDDGDFDDVDDDRTDATLTERNAIQDIIDFVSNPEWNGKLRQESVKQAIGLLNAAIQCLKESEQ